MISYTLIRSKRKTAAIHVHYDGVEVRAPLRMPKRDIDSFVLSKEKWIAEKVAILRERSDDRESFRLDYGCSIPLRGTLYPIAVSEGQIGFDGDCFRVPQDLSSEEIRYTCIQIYRMIANKVIESRLVGFAGQMGVSYNSVKISGAQKQWGSCTARGSLNFSWRLMMADDEVIDYVIVHELAHLIELNHSARYWTIVERVIPDFRARKKRLNELHYKLLGQNWKE